MWKIPVCPSLKPVILPLNEEVETVCSSLIYCNGLFAKFRVLILCCFSTWETNSSAHWWFFTSEEIPILRCSVIYNWYFLLTASHVNKSMTLGLKTNVYCSSPTYSLIIGIIFAPPFVSPFIFFHCNGHFKLISS